MCFGPVYKKPKALKLPRGDQRAVAADRSLGRILVATSVGIRDTDPSRRVPPGGSRGGWIGHRTIQVREVGDAKVDTQTGSSGMNNWACESFLKWIDSHHDSDRALLGIGGILD